jgi:hypothetical protein
MRARAPCRVRSCVDVARGRSGRARVRLRSRASVRGRPAPRHRHLGGRGRSSPRAGQGRRLVRRHDPRRRQDDLDRDAVRDDRHAAPPRVDRIDARRACRRRIGRRRRRPVRRCGAAHAARVPRHPHDRGPSGIPRPARLSPCARGQFTACAGPDRRAGACTGSRGRSDSGSGSGSRGRSGARRRFRAGGRSGACGRVGHDGGAVGRDCCEVHDRPGRTACSRIGWICRHGSDRGVGSGRGPSAGGRGCAAPDCRAERLACPGDRKPPHSASIQRAGDRCSPTRCTSRPVDRDEDGCAARSKDVAGHGRGGVGGCAAARVLPWRSARSGRREVGSYDGRSGAGVSNCPKRRRRTSSSHRPGRMRRAHGTSVTWWGSRCPRTSSRATTASRATGC